jgi:hypothetical protein
VNAEAATPLQQRDQAVLELLEIGSQLSEAVDQQDDVSRHQLRNPSGSVRGPQ